MEKVLASTQILYLNKFHTYFARSITTTVTNWDWRGKTVSELLLDKSFKNVNAFVIQ